MSHPVIQQLFESNALFAAFAIQAGIQDEREAVRRFQRIAADAISGALTPEELSKRAEPIFGSVATFLKSRADADLRSLVVELLQSALLLNKDWSTKLAGVLDNPRLQACDDFTLFKVLVHEEGNLYGVFMNYPGLGEVHLAELVAPTLWDMKEVLLAQRAAS